MVNNSKSNQVLIKQLVGYVSSKHDHVEFDRTAKPQILLHLHPGICMPLGQALSAVYSFQALSAVRSYQVLAAVRSFQALSAVLSFQVLSAVRSFQALSPVRSFQALSAVYSCLHVLSEILSTAC